MECRVSRRGVCAILAGLSLILAIAACSVPGLSLAPPTPTLFVLPTLAPSSTPAATDTPPPSQTLPPTPTAPSAATATPTLVGTSETGEIAAETPTPVQSSGEIDACALYTEAEVEALYGEDAAVNSSGSAPSQDGTLSRYCIYTTVTGYYVTISLLDYQTPEAAAQGFQTSKSQFGLTQTVSGLGDEAGFQPKVPFVGSVLVARQAKYLVSVSLVAGGDSAGNPAPPLDDETELQRAQAIMGTVLSRLP